MLVLNENTLYKHDQNKRHIKPNSCLEREKIKDESNKRLTVVLYSSSF